MSRRSPLTLVDDPYRPVAAAAPKLPAAADARIDTPREWFDAIAAGEGDVEHVHVAAVQVEAGDPMPTHIARSTVEECSFVGAAMRDSSLHDVVLRGVDLAGIDLRGATLRRVRLEGCRLVGAKLMLARLVDVVLIDCTLELANLREARLERVQLASCRLRQADLQGLRGSSVRLSSCDLADATFHRASFERSRVVDCDVEQLKGVDGLGGCTIDLLDAIELAPKLASALGIRIAEAAEDAESGGASPESR